MGFNWFIKKEYECKRCNDYDEVISHIAELDEELTKWDLEAMLERIHMHVMGKENPRMEEDKKNLKYIGDLVTIISKYIELKEKN